MSPRRRAAVVAGGVAVLIAVAAGSLALATRSDGGGDGGGDGATPVVRAVEAAAPPFESLTAGRIRIGDRALVVVVADEEPERSQGLRGKADAAPYDGMLFVFDVDARPAFTMAGVPAALDIGFYAADGSVVDRLRMEPCAGTDATCPVYQARGPFRFALETAPGALPAGPLRSG